MSKSKKEDQVTDPLVIEMMDIFEWAYNSATPYLKTLTEIQQNYDNQADEALWPTVTNMPVPSAFNAVEKALPQAFDFLFPRKQMIRMIPEDDEVEMETIQRSERFLEYTLKTIMKLKKTAYATIKSCYKLGIGYGIVEQINTTPYISKKISVRGGTKNLATRQMVKAEKPVRSLRYKDINVGQVIPTPDGSDTNGAKRASIIFYIDFYNEEDFRDMFKDMPTDGEDKLLSGNVEEIIQLARDKQFSMRVPVADMIASLAGKDLKHNNDYNENMPVQIPVLKCYAEKQHIWIAMERIVWKEENTYQTMRCPISICTAWPDADRWYPTTPPWVTRRLARGYSVFVNAMVDMLTQYFDPPMVYDAKRFGQHGAPSGMPGEKIRVEGVGRIDDALGYLKQPPIPNQMFTIGDMISGAFGDSVNQPEFASNPSAGVMRGGGFAFADANKPISMRDALAAAILETNWLDSVVTQTMIELQTIAMSGSGKLSFIERTEEYNDDDDTFVETTTKTEVSEEDIVRAYNVEVDLDIKHSNSIQDQNTRFGKYDRMAQNQLVDQYENLSLLVNDDDEFKRLMPSRKKAREQQEEQRQAQLEATRRGEAQGQGQGQGLSNPGAEAVAGALAEGAGIGG